MMTVLLSFTVTMFVERGFGFLQASTIQAPAAFAAAANDLRASWSEGTMSRASWPDGIVYSALMTFVTLGLVALRDDYLEEAEWDEAEVKEKTS